MPKWNAPESFLVAANGSWPAPGVLALLLVALTPVLTLGQIMDQAQEPKQEMPKNVPRAYAIGELEALPVDELQTRYEQSMAELRQVTKDLRRSGAHFFHAPSNQAHVYSKEWKGHAERGRAAYQKIKELSLELFLRLSDPPEDLIVMARIMKEHAFTDGRLGISYRVNKKMIQMFPNDEQLAVEMGRVAIYHNDFDAAAKLVETNPLAISEFEFFDKAMFSNLETLQGFWAREQKIREEEAEADDLPQVELTTTKGKIVIELFEDHAPHTVGNFVSLIDAEFYHGLLFHRVFRNYRASGGLWTLEQMRTTGYEIVDESQLPEARRAFRGSVSVLPSREAQGSSEFYINVAPQPFPTAVSQDTVIGRVIEGIEVVEALNVTAMLKIDGTTEVNKEVDPDSILSTRVIRRRDHAYVPKTKE